LEYLQQLQDEVLEKEAALLESAKESQVAESKHKKVATGDKEGQRPSKKAKGKQQERYHGDAAVKMGGANPCEKYMSTEQNCLVHYSR